MIGRSHRQHGILHRTHSRLFILIHRLTHSAFFRTYYSSSWFSLVAILFSYRIIQHFLSHWMIAHCPNHSIYHPLHYSSFINHTHLISSFFHSSIDRFDVSFDPEFFSLFCVRFSTPFCLVSFLLGFA